MKATRDGFGDGLVDAANPNIIVVGMDLNKATKADKFTSLYPDNYYEVGIAEANGIGIASGLADNGYRVFISSFASFLTGRYDIIRCSLAYSKAPVVLVGTHSGLAIGRDGVTQMGLEDVNLMRGLPNMKIIQPATYNEARAATKWLAQQTDGPYYLRLGRQPVEEFFPNDYEFETRPQQLMAGTSKYVFLSTGCVLPEVMKAAKECHGTVWNVPVLKPFDLKFLNGIIDTTLVVVEDHNIIGGLGSAVCEEACNRTNINVIRIGLNDTFPESGKPEDLYSKYKLDAKGILEQLR